MCCSIRSPTTRVEQHPEIVRDRGTACEVGDGAARTVSVAPTRRCSYLESGQPIRIDRPFFFVAQLRQAVGHRLVESAQTACSS